jgi:TadE-like protein
MPGQYDKTKKIIEKTKGQALVESVIVVPLMTFLILGVVQLAMIQHAKLMTEYAAFNAARAGIVWNNDKSIMGNAATIALLPTYGGLIDETAAGNPMKMLTQVLGKAILYQVNRKIGMAVDSLRAGAAAIIGNLSGALAGSLGSFANTIIDRAANYAYSAAANAVNSIFGDQRTLVNITLISPTENDFSGPTAGSGNCEIEFDDVTGDDEWRRKTRLTVRVDYYYMMRIPFANRIILTAYIAAQAGKNLYGAVWRPQTKKGATGFLNNNSETMTHGTLEGATNERLSELWSAAKHGIFMIILPATYTMRMQSNPYQINAKLDN